MAPVKFLPVISSIQKIRVYETKSIIYLIGCNSKETRFRILKIKRSAELDLYEDPNEYEDKEIRRFIATLKYSRSISAFGMLGFVRFLESYYLVLVTKRNKISCIGYHIIYTIKDTLMYKINADGGKTTNHPYEQKYLKMFMNVDLSSNFYFSYSYDLSRTLQYNSSEPKFVGTDVDIENEEKSDWSSYGGDDERIYAYRSTPRKRFVWNNFLLSPVQDKIIHKDWMLDIIHGFISQSSISIFGRPIYVCLIARRSARFAGTRFLKRGANLNGDVANEVETEQIVMDGNRMCSFVQLRGSIPSHWSQDISKMVPKPQILIDLADPFAETAGKHFEKLLFHYGSPVIVLNLVKKREKRKHECLLTGEFVTSIKYLNQFLPANCKIRYIHFDMARKNRTDANVMDSLGMIAENAIQQTGMFFIDNNEISSRQCGIIRVNCVDCLDRTNTAQFSVGKCVLAHQLQRLGFLGDPPRLEFDSECIKMLESLYELHGDTLALQYGGSQLVHRIKTYRKTSAWPVDKGNDIMQTLSRYYSNTFSDTEKQHSINLFLGYFQPMEDKDKKMPIWEFTNDYHMHNPVDLTKKDQKIRPKTQWFSDIIFEHLPQSTSNENKIVKELIRVHSKELEMLDLYCNYYVTFQFSSLEQTIAFQISHMANIYMPTFRTNFSPFAAGKRIENRTLKNPSLTGKSSSGSTSSNSSSEEDGTSNDDEEIECVKRTFVPVKLDHQKNAKLLKMANVLPNNQDIYGFQYESLNFHQLQAYKNYVSILKKSSPQYNPTQPGSSGMKFDQEKMEKTQPFNSKCLGNYVENVRVKVNASSCQMYQNYCNLIVSLNYEKTNASENVIRDYVNFIH